ncbi:M81 family metallopeptidase [Lunatibacter salilacus]|uniref:M81 family metallopeptidase n=1 Tax=Lunatibacter salilacus TaxID=2483804 RepID=UPI001F22F0D8|nr:M81 family metallopeptidase [Lunatibacter salilacus]
MRDVNKYMPKNKVSLLPKSRTSGKLRIGILGIYHESNTFLPSSTEWPDFENGHLLTGNKICEEYRSAFHEIGGILEVLEKEDTLEIIPILYAEATPSGTISSGTADKLMETLHDQLLKSLPLDGLMVVPHGAAVAVGIPDFDGHWLSWVRSQVGPDMPIVGTIDPHCNLSQQMVDAVNALVAYKTNPHIDQREVGKEAAGILLDALSGRRKPKMKAVQLPMAISIEMQHTGSSPCLELYQLSARLAARPGIMSTSIVLGFPYADVPEMGSSLIVVSDGDDALALVTLIELQRHMENHHCDFSGKKIGLEDLIPEISEAEKPLLLLDMGDNVGGGSPGDSTFLLKILEDNELGRSFVCIYDPEAVGLLKAFKPEDNISVKVGGKTDRNHGDPVLLKGKLLRTVLGKFTENQPRHGGQVNFDMGETAIVETIEGNTVMVTSRRVVPFSLQQLIQSGINPEDYQILVAKGVNAPLAAYMPVCKQLIRVNTPGVTRADMQNLPYKNRRKPLFPFEPMPLSL